MAGQPKKLVVLHCIVLIDFTHRSWIATVGIWINFLFPYIWGILWLPTLNYVAAAELKEWHFHNIQIEKVKIYQQTDIGIEI